MTHGLDRVAARRTHATPAAPLLLLLGVLTGAARAAGTGYWHTSGNRILDATNQPVRIAAINWYGFETTTFVAHGLWINDYKAILDLHQVVRFQHRAHSVLRPDGVAEPGARHDQHQPQRHQHRHCGERAALDVLDKIIAYCGKIGLRVMLDNHRSNAGNSAQENGLWFTGDFPETTWLANWRALTTRYLGNTTVVAWICAMNRTPAPAGAAIRPAAAPPTTGRPPLRAPATPSSRSTRIC